MPVRTPAGRVRLAGDIEEILAEHRLLVGPRTTDWVAAASGVIEVSQSDRHTTLLGTQPRYRGGPGWQAQPVNLDDLVLAYLRQPQADSDRDDVFARRGGASVIWLTWRQHRGQTLAVAVANTMSTGIASEQHTWPVQRAR